MRSLVFTMRVLHFTYSDEDKSTESNCISHLLYIVVDYVLWCNVEMSNFSFLFLNMIFNEFFLLLLFYFSVVVCHNDFHMFFEDVLCLYRTKHWYKAIKLIKNVVFDWI